MDFSRFLSSSRRCAFAACCTPALIVLSSNATVFTFPSLSHAFITLKVCTATSVRGEKTSFTFANVGERERPKCCRTCEADWPSTGVGERERFKSVAIRSVESATRISPCIEPFGGGRKLPAPCPGIAEKVRRNMVPGVMVSTVLPRVRACGESVFTSSPTERYSGNMRCMLGGI